MKGWFKMNNFLYAMKFSFEKMCSEIHRILDMTVYSDKEKREVFLQLAHVYIGFWIMQRE